MHWRATSRTDFGGENLPGSHYGNSTPADSSDYELGAGMLWALVVIGPAIVVLGTAFGYMALAPLVGLPTVPAF